MAFDRNRHLVIIGMPRGGTTYLYNSFNDHPDMFVPVFKEVCFFASAVYSKGKQWYEALFANCRENQTAVDVSPPLFLEEGAFQRLAETYPDAKVIMIVRDPVEWALSFYYQLTGAGLIDVPFDTFCSDRTPFDTPNGKFYIDMRNDYIFRKINEAMGIFGGNLLLYKFEYFKQNKVEVMNIIEDFLELSRYYHDKTIIKKKINYSGRKYADPVSSIMYMGFVRFFIKFLPESFVKNVRTKIDRYSAPKDNKKVAENYFTDEEYSLAKKYLNDQGKAIDKLFAASPVIKGDGSIWEAT